MKRSRWVAIPVLVAMLAAACVPAAPAPAPQPTAPPAQPAAPKAAEAPVKAAPTAAPVAKPAAEKPAAAAKPAPAASKVDFSGKSVRFIVGLAAGGGYDTYARVTARHIERHLPGNPSVVVENMTGGGSLVAANFLAKKAKPDGLTIGSFNPNLLLLTELGAKGPQFKSTDFAYIGGPSQGIPVCAFMGFTGIKTWDDVLKSQKELKMGATRVGSTTGDVPLILKEIFPELKMKLVDGYDGTSKIRLALEAREVDGACWTWDSMKVTGRAMLDAEGDDKLIPVLHEGGGDDPELKTVTQFTEIIKDPDHESMFNAWMAPYNFARVLVLPPGTPKDIVNVWRTAYTTTMKDKAFIDEAEKTKLELTPYSGEQAERRVAEMAKISPKAKQALQFLVTN